MTTPEPKITAPKAFISYSWDDHAHRDWVKQLAIRLRADGVDVTLDRWHAAPGDQIPAFMERAVRENDFVIAVCTPPFKERSDRRGGGVGYEGDIMTAYALTGSNTRKFIPVLRRGSWEESAPTWLLGRAKIDLIGEPYSESEYDELLRTLHGAREEAPPIGPRPNFGDKKGPQASPAPATVTPVAGSSTPRDQSSVTSWLAMTCALLIVALAVVAGWMEATRQFDPEPVVPPGLGSAILGIELASSAADAHALFRDPMGCHNRDVFRGQIHEDWYFIGIYWSLLSGLGGLLAFREPAGWRVLAAIVMLMVTGAAIFDVLENRGILAMIDRLPEELDDAAVLKTRTASLTKWGLSFAAMGPVSLVFFGRKSVGRAGPVFANLAGACLLLGSILGLVGLVYNPAISWAVLAISPGMVLAFLVLAITPEIL